MLPVLLAVFVLVGFFMYIFILFIHNYWKRRDIPQPPTTFYGGNIGETLTLKKNLGLIYADIYQGYQEYPFVGIYKAFTPSLLIRHPEVVKEVILKEFSNFYDNTISFDENDPIIGRNPFVLNGNKWKTVRSQLTPLFTSSRIKSLVAIFNDGGKKMVNYLEEFGENNEVDAKDLTIRFSIDNVVSYALGLEAKSFENDNTEFKKILYDLFESSIFQEMLLFAAIIFPALLKFFKIRFAKSSTEKRFVNIVSDSIKLRLESNIVRNDLLDSLIAMKNSGSISDNDICVTIGGFYIDGIETSATVLHYLLYEIAAHPWTQEELKEEIEEILAKYEGTVTYEAIQEMKYLDAVFNESIRLNAPISFMDRQPTQKTTLYGTTPITGKQMQVSLEVGTPVIIPIRGLHLDEKYFPDPLTFKPERFLPENKDTIPKFAYLPFGEGPRICLGKLFGTTQVKVGAIHVIRNFKLSLGNSVSYPFRVDPISFILRPTEPIKIKFQKRN